MLGSTLSPVIFYVTPLFDNEMLAVTHHKGKFGTAKFIKVLWDFGDLNYVRSQNAGTFVRVKKNKKRNHGAV